MNSSIRNRSDEGWEDESEEDGDEVEQFTNDEGESSEEEEDEEETAIEKLKQELESLPFVELQALRDRIGMVKFKELFQSVSGTKNIGVAEEKTVERPARGGKLQSSSKLKKDIKGKDAVSKNKRSSKNAPRETSSKQTVTRLRKVVDVKLAKARDPRFDDLSGTYNSDLWQKAYGFIDEYRAEELAQLQVELRKEKDLSKREEIQSLIEKMKQADNQKRREQARSALKSMARKSEAKAVAQGKVPFYLKKSEQKRLDLVAKFNHLKDKGELDKYLEKRRKKNTSKDHRYVPYQRR
eukprot:CFRG4966T1